MLVNDLKYRLWFSILTVLAGGCLAAGIGWGDIPNNMAAFILGVTLFGVLILTKPRQPEAVLYRPRNFATRLLKWFSAPQVEAAILLWFGLALLMQPNSKALFREGQSVIGWLFLLLGWLLVARLPNPVEFTLIISTRLCFIALVALEALQTGAPLIVVGAYIASILHGILAMLLRWTLREVAEQVAALRQEVRRLQT